MADDLWAAFDEEPRVPQAALVSDSYPEQNLEKQAVVHAGENAHEKCETTTPKKGPCECDCEESELASRSRDDASALTSPGGSISSASSFGSSNSSPAILQEKENHDEDSVVHLTHDLNLDLQEQLKTSEEPPKEQPAEPPVVDTIARGRRDVVLKYHSGVRNLVRTLQQYDGRCRVGGPGPWTDIANVFAEHAGLRVDLVVSSSGTSGGRSTRAASTSTSTAEPAKIPATATPQHLNVLALAPLDWCASAFAKMDGFDATSLPAADEKHRRRREEAVAVQRKLWEAVFGGHEQQQMQKNASQHEHHGRTTITTPGDADHGEEEPRSGSMEFVATTKQTMKDALMVVNLICAGDAATKHRAFHYGDAAICLSSMMPEVVNLVELLERSDWGFFPAGTDFCNVYGRFAGLRGVQESMRFRHYRAAKTFAEKHIQQWEETSASQQGEDSDSPVLPKIGRRAPDRTVQPVSDWPGLKEIDGNCRGKAATTTREQIVAAEEARPRKAWELLLRHLREGGETGVKKVIAREPFVDRGCALVASWPCFTHWNFIQYWRALFGHRTVPIERYDASSASGEEKPKMQESFVRFGDFLDEVFMPYAWNRDGVDSLCVNELAVQNDVFPGTKRMAQSLVSTMRRCATCSSLRGSASFIALPAPSWSPSPSTSSHSHNSLSPSRAAAAWLELDAAMKLSNIDPSAVMKPHLDRAVLDVLAQRQQGDQDHDIQLRAGEAAHHSAYLQQRLADELNANTDHRGRICTLSVTSLTQPLSAVTYLAQHDIFKQFRLLKHDVPWCEYATASSIWMGSANTITELHTDTMDNVYMQVCGFKRIKLAKPGFQFKYYLKQNDHEAERKSCRDGQNTKANQAGNGVEERAASSDDEGNFMKGFRAFGEHDDIPLCYDFVVGPGDVVFIPKGWWHGMKALTPSISVNFWEEL